MMKLHWITAMAMLALLLGGCADDMDRAPVDEAPAGTWTQIMIQRDVDQGPAAPWDVEAWFARFSGVGAPAVRSAMNVIDSAPPGCTLMPSKMPHQGEASVRFLATGTAQIKDAAGTTYTLPPHPLALHTGAISGVIYARSIAQGNGEAWRIRITNADGSPRLNMQQTSPEGWGIVAVNGRSTFSQPFHLGLDAPLDLRIDTDAQHVFVVLQSTAASDGPRLMCRVENHHILLRPDQLDSLTADHESIELTLIMRNGATLVHDHQTVGRASVELHDHLTIVREDNPGDR